MEGYAVFGVEIKNVFGTFFKKYLIEWVDSWVLLGRRVSIYYVLLLVWVWVKFFAFLSLLKFNASSKIPAKNCQPRMEKLLTEHY